MKKLLLPLLLVPTLLLSQTLPPLSIDQEKFVSDTKGALVIKNILALNVGDTISLTTQDGNQFKGKIFQREEEKGSFIKIYGHLNEDERSGFGFIFSKEDGLNGALVFKKTDTDYVIIFNKEDNSFYFVKAVKVPRTVRL